MRAALHRSLGDAHQLRHLRDRPVFLVQQPPHLAVRAAGRAERRVAAARSALASAASAGSAAARLLVQPAGHGRPARASGAASRPGSARSPRARPPGCPGLVGFAFFHTAMNVSCSTSSTSSGGSALRSRTASHGACRAEQFPQRRVVAAGQARAISSSSSITSSIAPDAAAGSRPAEKTSEDRSPGLPRPRPKRHLPGGQQRSGRGTVHAVCPVTVNGRSLLAHTKAVVLTANYVEDIWLAERSADRSHVFVTRCDCSGLLNSAAHSPEMATRQKIPFCAPRTISLKRVYPVHNGDACGWPRRLDHAP